MHRYIEISKHRKIEASKYRNFEASKHRNKKKEAQASFFQYILLILFQWNSKAEGRAFTFDRLNHRIATILAGKILTELQAQT